MARYDDILKNVVGEFGTYQKICFILMGIASMQTGMITLSPVLLFAKTDSWCQVPEVDAISQQFCVANITSNCEELVKNLTIPREKKETGCSSTWTFEQCNRYNVSYAALSYTQNTGRDAYVMNASKIPCDDGWQYDRSRYKSTVSQQFDLVCDRFYLNALLSSAYMLGFFVGSVFNGYILDRFGRMKGFMFAQILTIIFGVIEAFAPNYIVFIIVRFFLAVFTYGIYLSGFILVCECVGPTKRTVVGMVFAMFFGFGTMLLAVYAYFVREWWVLQLMIIVPNAIFLCVWWIVSESSRWLIAKGRIKEAEETIRKAARINKVTIPKDLFDDEVWKTGDAAKQDSIDNAKQNKSSVLDLLRLPNMRKKSLILMFNWIIITLVYYGISFDTSNLGGNPYVNLFISGAVEIPAYAVGILAMEFPKMGRRGSLLFTMVFGGVACIILAFVPTCGDLVWVGITLAMLGKFGITAAFGMIYVYTAELYPTTLRSIGVGMCSLCARVGGMLAPQLILMGTLWKPLPPIVFGVTAIIAGILILPLPETRGEQLPETIEQAEQFGKKHSKEENAARYKGYGEIRKIEVNDNYEMNSV